MRETFALSSSALASASYDPDSEQLTVIFTNGRSYDFEGVPASVVEGLKHAGSAGTYFNTQIKGVYS